MANFKYNPSRESNSYPEYPLNQNTSLHFDHFKEEFLDLLYEYKPHDLYTSDIPVGNFNLDKYGYIQLQTQDLGESWGTFTPGNSYGSTVGAGANNTLDTGWDRVWVDQSWKFSLEIDAREGQLDNVKIADQIGRFMRTTGKNCIDAYRFHRMFYFACNAKTYLNEFVRLGDKTSPSYLPLPSDVTAGVAHKIGGDAIGHSGNVFRSTAIKSALTSENILHLHDSVEQNFENIQLPLDKNVIYMALSAKRTMKDLGGNLQRYIEQDSKDADIRRSVGWIDSWRIIPVPDKLLTVFFGKIDSPRLVSSKTTTSMGGGVSAANTAPLLVSSSAKDGYFTSFNKPVLDYFAQSDNDRNVKDFGTILKDMYGNSTDTVAKATESMLMIHVGRMDTIQIIQQFEEVKHIPNATLVNTLSDIVEMYWSHSLYSAVKLTSGLAVSLAKNEYVPPKNK